MVRTAGVPDLAAFLVKEAVGPGHPDFARGGDIDDGDVAAPVARAAADHRLGVPGPSAVPRAGVIDVAGIVVVIKGDIPDHMGIAFRIGCYRGIEEVVLVVGADADGRRPAQAIIVRTAVVDFQLVISRTGAGVPGDVEAAEVIGSDGGHAAVVEALIDEAGIGPGGAVIGGALVVNKAPASRDLMVEQMERAVLGARHAPA